MDYKLVRDIPLPEEYRQYFDDSEGIHKAKKTSETRYNDDVVKLDFLYPGRAVVCVDTKDGLAVVADTEVGKGLAREIQDKLPIGLRENSQIIFPELW